MNYVTFLLSCLVFTFANGNNSIITEAEILDLQLLQTYQGKPGVIGTLNKTITGTGTDFLKKRLLHPITDRQQLMRRQQAIAHLGQIQDQSLLELILGTFKENEQGLYSFIIAQDPIAQRSIENLYFKRRFLKRFNNCPAGLDFAQAVHAINLFAPVVEHVAIHFFISEQLHKYLGMCCPHGHHDHEAPKEHKHKHKHEHKHEHKAPSAGAVWAYRAYNVAHTLIHAINLTELAEHLTERALTIRQMQERLIAIRRCLDATKILVDTTRHLPASDFEHQELLRALVEKNQDILSPELYELVTLLEKNTFAGNASLFSRQGNILRAYTLALQTMPELLAALEGVGELDVILSCANLLKNSQEESPFCLVEYSQEETPAILVTRFWNLLNKSPNPIQEPFALEGARHVAIITGANKAGKSTASGAITQTILCAQTLTIAPAQSCTITPFSYIRTCFNPNAKVSDGQSLFSASIDFADQTLALCQHGKFIFIATDELFNSTEFSRGQQINDEMALSLAKHHNCIALLATHFQPTTTLEGRTRESIINLKAEMDENGYHLSPGIGSVGNILEFVKDSEIIKRTGLV